MPRLFRIGYCRCRIEVEKHQLRAVVVGGKPNNHRHKLRRVQSGVPFASLVGLSGGVR